MRPARLLPPFLLGVSLGTALWASSGVLDQLPIDGRMTRVALLPSWPVWIGLIVGATLLLLAVQHAILRRVDGAQPVAMDWALPLLALAVLLVPYLPWVADQWPMWQVLAGPFRWLLWAAVAGQLAWVAWQHRWITAPRAAAFTPAKGTTIVWIAVLLGAGWAASRITSTTQFPTGDEPHYLVIAQSLWRDGDLKIENNHDRGDYREYFAGELSPHYLTRGVDEEIYSIHPIGMPVLVAPVYAAGGYPLVVGLFVLLAATAAALIWRASVAWLGDASAATFGWAAIVTSAPFLLNIPTIYPEIPAALCVALAFTIAVRRNYVQKGLPPSLHLVTWRWWAAGVAVAALPWLSTKYAPMSAALAAVLIARAWLVWTPWPTVSPASGAARASAGVAIPYAVSLAGWFAFFQAYWGAPWPSGPYGTLTQTTPMNLWFGAPGLLFDQEYGLLPYAPVLILAVPGLWRMLRDDGDRRRMAVETLLVFGALFVTVGAFRIWWGGTAVVGRPVVSGLLLLALPVAIQYAAVPAGSARRAAQYLLLWVGAAITLTLILVRDGLLLGNQRDGTASLLMWLSPRWDLWSAVPTFVQGHTDVAVAWLHSLAWLTVAVAAGLLLARVRARSAGVAALASLVTLAAGLAGSVAAMSLLPEAVTHPQPNLEVRSELTSLNGFDASRRPIAIIYDPWRVVPADALTPYFVLKVAPEVRASSLPARLLHNGRFSLPAGRYRAIVHWADDAAGDAETLGLQLGRSGPAWREWTVAPQPGGGWDEEFTLPIDVSLVGFRGSAALESRVASIEVRAVSVVNQSARPSTPDVLGAASFDDVSVFFHDGVTHGEPNGFWALGARTTDVMVWTPVSRTSLRLRVHSGEVANRVTLTAPGWSRTLDLVPGQSEAVEIPISSAPVWPLTISADSGFVPSALNPASSDHRRLGAWIGIEAER